MKTRKWHVRPPAPAGHLAMLAESTEGNLLLAQLLYNRGIVDPKEAELFLRIGDSLCHDPFLLNDMERAVQRIIRSLVGRELIAVYGDYDADGVTGTVLLCQVLSSLGGLSRAYIPHRVEEGYGLNRPALTALSRAGVKLVIAVDCGTNAADEVNFASSLGIDIIIADHHTVASSPTAAMALLNPKRADSVYPFRDLASVGVAYKLAQALLRSYDTVSAPREDDFLDLVAIGTVADLVPLVGENRYLVKRGLEILNTTNRLGLQQLVLRAGLHLGGIDTGAIGYILGPRLNAAGRLDDAKQSFNLLNTEDVFEARRLAALLEEKNAERQRMTNDALSLAREDVLLRTDGLPILVTANGSYPPGVLGLVAGKLAEEFYRPAVVVEVGEEDCRGSARSIPEFNIVEALEECKDLLVRFGGHAQAAGFTVKRSLLPRLRERLVAIAGATLSSIELQPSLTVDAETPLSYLNGRTLGLLHRLTPCGLGNPTPSFLAREVKVLEHRQVGPRRDHLKLRLSGGGVVWPAIGFGLGGMVDQISAYIDIVYSLEDSFWNGERLVQLRVSDLRRSGE